MSNKVISIEGNKFSGSNQLFKDLQKYYEHDDSVCFISRPVSQLTDNKCNSIDQLYHIEPEQYAFTYHLDRLTMMYKAVKNALDCEKFDLIITEESIYSLKAVYLTESVNRGEIPFLQYQLYCEIFNRYANELSLDGILYFKTSPIVCHLRSRLVNDPNTSTLEQFETFDEAFERWLNVISAIPRHRIYETTYDLELNHIISFLDFRL